MVYPSKISARADTHGDATLKRPTNWRSCPSTLRGFHAQCYSLSERAREKRAHISECLQ